LVINTQLHIYNFHLQIVIILGIEIETFFNTLFVFFSLFSLNYVHNFEHLLTLFFIIIILTIQLFVYLLSWTNDFFYHEPMIFFFFFFFFTIISVHSTLHEFRAYIIIAILFQVHNRIVQWRLNYSTTLLFYFWH
jgi:hypothetical protein